MKINMRSDFLLALVVVAGMCLTLRADPYLVAVSEADYAQPGWKKVCDTLLAKHADAKLLTYPGSVTNALQGLQKADPRAVAFVATPQNCGKQFVREIHLVMRAIDPDVYTDAPWGILTGLTPEEACTRAAYATPLVVTNTLANTAIPLENLLAGEWYDELQQSLHVSKQRGGGIVRDTQAEKDPAGPLARKINSNTVDLIVGSGHATERDWQIGYRYAAGSFRCDNNQLHALTYSEIKQIPILSTNPKIYLPCGNCLMGHVNGTQAMALAWMRDANVLQMAGYTVPTWFGYAGWGILDYLLEMPGRYTFAEAFMASQLALDYLLLKKPSRGLQFDQTVVAFYGDPLWEARMASVLSGYEQTLTKTTEGYTLTVTPLRGANSFKLLSYNGSERGNRPIIAFLPERLKNPRVAEGSELNPVVTSRFILLPLPTEMKASYTVRIEREVLKF
jgi:zinc protease